MSKMMIAVYVLVTVRRSMMEVTPQTVYSHELPLLEAKHGEGNVTLIDELPEGVDPTPYEKTHELDVDAEWDRLDMVYGKHPEMSMPLIEFVFRGERAALAKAGLKDAEKATSNAAIDTDGDANIDINEIRAKLDELGVERKGIRKRALLLSLLRSNLIDRLDELEAEFDEDDSVEVLAKALKDAEAE